MKVRNLTQVDVASACKVSQPTVQRWLKGAMPGGIEVYRLAKFLEVSVEFLLFEDAPSQLPQEDEGTSFAVPKIAKTLSVLKKLEIKIEDDLKELRDVIKELEQ